MTIPDLYGNGVEMHFRGSKAKRSASESWSLIFCVSIVEFVILSFLFVCLSAGIQLEKKNSIRKNMEKRIRLCFGLSKVRLFLRRTK